MTMDEVRAVVDEAHRNHLPVVAHSHRAEEIRRGIQAGVDCFEHTGLGSAPEYPPDVFDLMKGRANTLFWTPTIGPLLLYRETRDEFPERLDDPRWQEGLPKEVAADIRRSLAHPESLSYFQNVPARWPTLKRKFEQLRQSGVILLIGTDSGVPLNFHSDSTWREIDAWVNVFGVAPMDALRAATFWPAVAMKKDKETGTVSPGKYADVIAVEDEGADTAGPRRLGVSPGEQKNGARVARVRDPLLRARDPPAVARRLGTGPERTGIGTGLGLGKGE